MSNQGSNQNNNTSIAVLSYNICFQAMTNYSGGSASELGRKCTYIRNSRLTICGNNMATMIDAIPASMNIPALDFVGFQEASRWKELQGDATGTLNKMQAIGSKEGRSEMVSFYDGAKYTLTKQYFGRFLIDRPFQILFFKSNAVDNGVIFINAHNPHGYSFCKMQAALSSAIENRITDEEKKYQIIAVGDFNETSWDWQSNSMKQNSWTPFSELNLFTSISVGAPVFSCSQADGVWSDGQGGIRKGSRGGDYIFSSGAAADIKVPPAYDPKLLQSDHLPIVAIV